MPNSGTDPTPQQIQTAVVKLENIINKSKQKAALRNQPAMKMRWVLDDLKTFVNDIESTALKNKVNELIALAEDDIWLRDI